MRKEYKFPMPASILKLNSTLTQDDYNRALCMLKNDIRFQLHIFLYRRLQTIWILFSSVLCIFLPILLSAHLETIVILGSCLLWLILQAAGLVVGGRCRKKLDLMLERSVAQVNSYFMDHKLMLGVINVGGLCKRSRLVIPMVYFDTFGCIEQIESIVSTDLKSIEADRNGDSKHKQQVALDYSKIGLHRMEPNQRALAKSQLAKKIVLRFSQRWISHFDGSKLMFTDDDVTRPRHLSTGKCLCQFIEEHFKSNQSEQIKDLDDEPLDDCCKVEMTNDTSAPTPNTTLTTTSTTATTTTITTSTTTQPEFEENNQAIMQHKINRPLIIDLANNYNGLLEQYAALLQSQKNYCRDEFDPELNVSKLDELLKGELLRNKMFDEQMGQIRDSILHMTSENCEKTPIITTRFNKPLQV
uniref:Uncharacterized protein n=1 Tax=Aceria tosichella TaxID=561515 RepID=A0A6G1SPC9_9ACAR